MPSNSPTRPFDGTMRRLDLKEFAGLDDGAFLRAAYWQLLGRSPDPGGFAQFLRRLATGVSRIEILGDIRFSAEGRAAARPATGLLLRYAWYVLLRSPGVRRLALARRPQQVGHPSAGREVVEGSTRTEVGGANPYFDGLVAYNDVDFVAETYRQYLGREPDVPGHHSYIARLHAGETRRGVLDSIRMSPEARSRDGSTDWRPGPANDAVLAANHRPTEPVRFVIAIADDVIGKRQSGRDGTQPPEGLDLRDQLRKAAVKWTSESRRISRLGG